MMTGLPCSDERRALRGLCRADRHVPVHVMDGTDGPRITGDAGHHTTPGGKPCRYPSAYRRAYGRPVYHCSTVRVEVGSGWLESWRKAGGVYRTVDAAADAYCRLHGLADVWVSTEMLVEILDRVRACTAVRTALHERYPHGAKAIEIVRWAYAEGWSGWVDSRAGECVERIAA